MTGLSWLPAAFLLAAPNDALFEEARLGAQQHLLTLPNFLCRQTTLRDVRVAGASKWTLSDVLSAEVAFEGGKEDYRWLLHNGVPAQSLESVQSLGTTSTGEWGSVLASVFHPARQPVFGATTDFERAGFRGRRYRLSVTHENSAWELVAGTRLWKSAYDAVVEVDEKMRRAVRIELQARDLPADFPLASASTMLELGLVRIQEQPFLLPVRSVVDLCIRGAARCTRNSIEFFGHRRFQASSRLIGDETPALSSQTDAVLSRVLGAERRRWEQAEGREYYRQYLVGEAHMGRPSTPTGSSIEKVTFRKGRETPEKKDSKQPAAYAAYLEALTELFHPDTRAEFSDGGLYLREPVEVRIYFFQVTEERSRLKIQNEGRSVAVAYTGALLVETASGRVHTFSLRTGDLSKKLPVYQVQKAVLFQPAPQTYRKDPVPAQAVDLFWRDSRTALHQETRYSTQADKR